MSLVCFPFKEEDISVVLCNVETAASHPLVAAVLCVGYSRGRTWHRIRGASPLLQKAYGKRILLLLQHRIGTSLRGGKGDGMNTALEYFLAHPEFSRLHFYDADIASFSKDWISKAEKVADRGFDVVRHYFPRSSTDAMITWLITKVGFALLWPNSALPMIEQPLGGELLLTRKAVEILHSDCRVRLQSDWGIDTLFTFVLVQKGIPMAEVYVPEGKVHKLYGCLSALKTMVVECFAAIRSLRNERVDNETGAHHIEPAKTAPKRITQRVAYDIEKTMHLLKRNWTPRQRQLLQTYFHSDLAKGLESAREWPTWKFANEEAWIAAYQQFLEHFEKGDEDWEELLFKVWMSRVLNHTLTQVLRGYDEALGALRSLIWDTAERSSAKETRT